MVGWLAPGLEGSVTKCLFKLYVTVESGFVEPPRKTKIIGLRNWEFKKIRSSRNQGN